MKFIKVVFISFIAIALGEQVSQAQTDWCSQVGNRTHIVNKARKNIAQSQSRIQQNSQDFSAQDSDIK